VWTPPGSLCLGIPSVVRVMPEGPATSSGCAVDVDLLLAHVLLHYLLVLVEAIAEATGEDPEELLEYATDAVRRDVIGKKQAAEQVGKDLARMSRERLLPRVEILEKVARYEAHLSLGLYKALHEVEALQTRNLGGSAPLACLDLDGLAES
jgi:hypothetical protein